MAPQKFGGMSRVGELVLESLSSMRVERGEDIQLLGLP